MTMFIIVTLLLSVNVYAYENEIFKIEVPADYVEMSYSGLYTFVKSEEKGIVVYAFESAGLKKDISAMSQSDVEELIGELISDDVTILEQEKEKLGKSKAIKARVKDEEDSTYMDMYIVLSDKHILFVCFTAATEAELDDIEYLEIKASFKMKEKTTNATLVKAGIFVLACGGVVLKAKRRYIV